MRGRRRVLQVCGSVVALCCVLSLSALSAVHATRRRSPVTVGPAEAGQHHHEQKAAVDGVTDWLTAYSSAACLAHRSMPVGRARDGNVGRGRRAVCLDPESTDEFRKEIFGSVDVSLSHRVIYVPVMKAGTQMFAEVLAERFGAVRMPDRDLLRALRKHGLALGDFFVFTVVRSPFSMFRSGYGEMSLYAAHGKIARTGFALVPQIDANEPARALECLANVRAGTFSRLVPAHLFTQVWKTHRCVGRSRSALKLSFVGHLENIEADWKFVEQRLGVAHEPLPRIHSSDNAAERAKAKRMLEFAATGRFANLTRAVCEYYRGDFECFGFDDALCRSLQT